MHRVKRNMAPAAPEEDKAQGGAEVRQGYTGREETIALTRGVGHPDTWLVDPTCRNGADVKLGYSSRLYRKMTRKDQRRERNSEPHGG